VRADRYGLTVAEALVAVVVLTVGVLALVGSAAQMSRMIGRGRHATVAAMAASARLERLRQIARSTSPPCASVEWRGGSAARGALTESWQLLDATGVVRRLQLIVSHRNAAGLSTDTIVSAVLCEPA